MQTSLNIQDVWFKNALNRATVEMEIVNSTTGVVDDQLKPNFSVILSMRLPAAQNSNTPLEFFQAWVLELIRVYTEHSNKDKCYMLLQYFNENVLRIEDSSNKHLMILSRCSDNMFRLGYHEFYNVVFLQEHIEVLPDDVRHNLLVTLFLVGEFALSIADQNKGTYGFDVVGGADLAKAQVLPDGSLVTAVTSDKPLYPHPDFTYISLKVTAFKLLTYVKALVEHLERFPVTDVPHDFIAMLKSDLDVLIRVAELPLENIITKDDFNVLRILRAGVFEQDFTRLTYLQDYMLFLFSSILITIRDEL